MATDCVMPYREFLSADAVTVFGLISAGEPVPAELQSAVGELTRWGFVVLNADGNQPVPLDPRQIAQRRLEEWLAENAERIARIQALPAMVDQMALAYERAQWRAGHGSEYIDDPAVVNARLDDVIACAEWEILAAQPGGPRTEAQLNRSLARDTAAMERGVSKRTLYRAVARDNPVTAQYVRAMTSRPVGKRPEYRTLAGPFERCIVVDRRVAFISNHLVEGAPEHAAWQITDRAMVAYIAAQFEAEWRRADPWGGETRGRVTAVDTVTGGDGVRTTPRQREIMRDLVAGRDQRAIAGRLGVSVRTVAKEIDALKVLFDVQSREQLAFKWAFCADRLVDDSTPAEDPVGGLVAVAGDGAAA